MSTTPPTYQPDYSSPLAHKLEHIEQRIDNAAKARSRTRIAQRIEGLCGSCSHSMIYKTKRANEPVVICRELSGEYGAPIRMPVDIEECTRYNRIGQLDVSTLAQMATLIDPDHKQAAGFQVEIMGKP